MDPSNPCYRYRKHSTKSITEINKNVERLKMDHSILTSYSYHRSFAEKNLINLKISQFLNYHELLQYFTAVKLLSYTDETVTFLNYGNYHKSLRFSHHIQQHLKYPLNYHNQQRLPYNFMYCTFCALYTNVSNKELQEYATQQNMKSRHKIILPCVIPWESGTNKHASQKGTRGFGTIRDASKFHFVIFFK